MSNGIEINITAQMAQFTTAVRTATQQLQGLGQQGSSVGSTLSGMWSSIASPAGLAASAFAIVGGSLLSLTKNTIDMADGLNDLSKAVGLPVETLAGLKLATEETGTNLETLGKGLNKLSVNMVKNADDFKKIGVTSKDPIEAFAQLSDVIKGIEDPQLKAAVGTAALGKGWAELAPLLDEGSESIHAMTKEGMESAKVTTLMAEQSDFLNDQLASLMTTVEGVGTSFAGRLINGISIAIKKMQDATANAITLTNVMRGLSQILFSTDGLTGPAQRVLNTKKELDAALTKQNALSKQSPQSFGSLIDQIGGKGTKGKLAETNAEIDKLTKNLATYQGELKALENPIKETKKLSEATLKSFAGVKEPKAKKPKKPKKEKMSDEEREALQLTKHYEDQVKALEKQIGLRNAITELQKVEYDFFGKSSTITDKLKVKDDDKNAALKKTILARAAEIDKLNIIERKQQAILKDAIAAADLKIAGNDAIQADNIQSSFNGLYAQNADALKDGTIDEKTFKDNMGKLSRAYNSDFIDPAKNATNELSEAATQAAQGIQSSFAEFLFDPFANGVESMGDMFLKMIRKMAAEFAAAQIMNLLLGTGRNNILNSLTGSTGDTVSGIQKGGQLLKAGWGMVSGFFHHDGGMVGSSKRSMSLPASTWASAPRFHNGGFPGLKQDEVPAILQKGEVVLPKNYKGGSSGNVNNVTTNISIASDGSTKSNTISDGEAKRLSDKINAEVMRILNRETRIGGLLKTRK